MPKIKRKVFSRTEAEILLIIVILARSTSFVMTKMGLRDIGTFTLLGLRFFIAFVVLLPFGWKRLRAISGQTLCRGMVLGAAFFAVMAAEVSGLKTASASTASFLENSAIVFVPIFEAVLRRKLPSLSAAISAIICLCGVGFLTLKGGVFAMSEGELLCLLAAALYAGAIIITDRVSKQDDPLSLGMLQVGFMALYSIAAACLLETPKMPSSPSTWGMILYLAVICSGFGFTLQPLAQSRTTSERVGLFCALGPVGAAICGCIILHETLEPTGVIGIGLILFGMVFGSLYNRILQRRRTGGEP